MSGRSYASRYLAFEEYLADNPDGQVTDLKFQQLYATKQLNDLEISFKNGDKSSLMFAIFVCASSGLPLPPWASFAYSKAWADTIVFAKYKSWDAAFGLPYPKGAHLNAIKKERRLKNRVYSSIEASINAGTVVDSALFEAVSVCNAA